MRASAYANSTSTNHLTEQWLITPSFSSVSLTEMSLSFDNDQSNHPGALMQVFVSTDFDGDSANFETATWDEITGLTLSTGDYEIVNNVSDLSDYVENASVYVGFKYTSTDSEGAVWDIDNVTVGSGVSVQNLSSGVSIYPNPVYNTLNIKNINTIANVQILNVIGQEVITNAYNAKSVSLNTEILANGVYFVKVTNTNGQTSVTKIVKK